MANDGAPTDNGEPPSVAAGIGARALAEDEKCNMLMQAHNRISTLLRHGASGAAGLPLLACPSPLPHYPPVQQNTGIQGSSAAPAPSVHPVCPRS